MGLLPRACGVVEGAQHAGDVADGEVGPRPLDEGRSGSPSKSSSTQPQAGTQHLAEVVVAVDALQQRPRCGSGRSNTAVISWS